MTEGSERTTGGEHVVREAAVLAMIPVSGGSELRLVRLPDGLIVSTWV